MEERKKREEREEREEREYRKELKGWYGLQCFSLGIHTSLCIRWPFADTRSISEQLGFSTIRGVCSKSKTALPYYYQEENVIHTSSLTTENSKHDKQVRSRDSKIIPPPPFYN